MMIDAAPFANRLGKNIKHLQKWARRNEIEAWRAYDKDVPQFPFVVDIYGSRIHLQEYDTGWLMRERDYDLWLAEVLQAIEFVTGEPAKRISLKTHERQKGLSQYQKTGKTGDNFVVQEYGRKFWVNLEKYLDTGLFLDHRNLRQMVGSLARGQRFLNLFAYTGSFSVYAVTGGAILSETVDLSNTYLDWARDNFKLNSVDLGLHQNLGPHQIIREDVFTYLQAALKTGKSFDLIVLDPPSFSNSKKLREDLDIQRDHVRLIDGAMGLLAPGGRLYFSNNLRSFNLDANLALRYELKDMTSWSIPEDFRNKKIHQCYQIKNNN